MAELFPYFPTPVDEIIGIAARLASAADDTDATVEDLQLGMGRAVDAVDGDLTFPMEQAPKPAIRGGTNLAELARFASATMIYFGDAVEEYNRGVRSLNATWQAEPSIENYRNLARKEARLRSELDDVAAEVAAMLERGPNTRDQTFLDHNGYRLPTPLEVDEVLAAMPADGDPEAMREWWESLTLVQQVAAVAADPERIGDADGLPAEIRDEANRGVMADDLERLEAQERAGTLSDIESQALDNIRTVIESLAARQAHIDPLTGRPIEVQLYFYDPYAFDGDGRFAISNGNLDTADHTAVMVPGMNAQIGGQDSLNVYNESRWASGDSVAVLDWHGYDVPRTGGFDVLGVFNQDMARDGAERLLTDVNGLQAARGDNPTHLTVIGNSYGSTVAGMAASNNDGARPEMDVDDLILTGSPGVPLEDAYDDLVTGVEHTWVGSASRDWVTSFGRTGWMDPSDIPAALVPGAELLGNDPAAGTFNAQRFQAESVDRGDHWNLDDHSRYYDQNTESLYNIAAITTGQYSDVQLAQNRWDPLLEVEADWEVPEVFGVPIGPPLPTDVDVDIAMQDPERDRDPDHMSHAPGNP